MRSEDGRVMLAGEQKNENKEAKGVNVHGFDAVTVQQDLGCAVREVE